MDEKFIRSAAEAVDNWTDKELGKTPPRFGGEPGDAIPEVDPDDLKAIWRLQREVEAQHPGQRVAIDAELAKHYCKPEANIQAIGYRTGLLSLLKFVAPDKIAPWLRDSHPDDALFRVAAVMPLRWPEVGFVRDGFPFDIDDFFRTVRERQAEKGD